MHRVLCNIDVGIKAIEAAGKAVKPWKSLPMIKRRDNINRAAGILEQKVDDFRRRSTIETSCEDRWPGSTVCWAQASYDKMLQPN